VRGAAAEDDALDRPLARAAGVALAVVDAVELLEAAGDAVGVDVVAQGAAAVADGAAEDALDGVAEDADLLRAEPVGGSEGVEAGDVE
jgi:hypothetical protein